MKFFAISDMHSYHDAMVNALDKAGFDKNNPAHTLIVCGDAFDRGTQARAMLDYLNSLDRKILIKGNHDDMLINLLKKRNPSPADIQNGTLDTVYQLGYKEGTSRFSDYCDNAYKLYKPLYNQMLNCFETKSYIFTHSWVPVIAETKQSKPFIGDWRNAAEDFWADARWVNPYECAESGLKPDKTIVFGHWHTSWPRARYKGKEEFGTGADFSVYYGNGYIGLDAMTAYSGKVNVLIIEDEFLE